MLLALLVVPALAGVAVLLLRASGPRRAVLLAAALAHLGTTASAWVERPEPMFDRRLALDDLGLLFLSITSLLFGAVSVYAVGYLAREGGSAERRDFLEGSLFANEPEAIFVACLLFFLSAMTGVTVSQHLGLIWVAIEATTLASAPLIYFHRHHRSLEATWKYLLICSVGIALALLGNFALAASASPPASATQAEVVPLLYGDLVAQAGRLDLFWLKAAFLFFLVGYGTKMGLAPLHTWLPDAHSEAPSLVSALLSGALLNCAFLGILRAHQVCVAAGQAAFSQELLIGFGLLSMAFAAVFILGQKDYKRMLAYSSVEHMGILSLGVGLGGIGAYGAALHAVNHSLTKAMLFLVAGNILAAYHSKLVREVSGVGRRLPVSGTLWVAGFLAITGSPPFGPFLSEFTILRAAIDGGRPFVAGAYLTVLGAIFLGMAALFLPMAQAASAGAGGSGERGAGSGERDEKGGLGFHAPRSTLHAPRERESLLLTGPPVVLGLLVLVLGVYVPPPLAELLKGAAAALAPGGQGP